MSILFGMFIGVGMTIVQRRAGVSVPPVLIELTDDDGITMLTDDDGITILADV